MPGRPPAALQEEFRQRVRQQEAFLPDVRAAVPRRHQGPALPLGLALHRGPVLRRDPDGQPEALRWSERAQLPEPERRPAHAAVLLPRAASHRDARAGASWAQLPEPALRSAQVPLLVQALLPVLPRRGGRLVRRAKVPELPWGLPSRDVPQDQRRVAVPAASEPDGPRAEPQPAE